MNKKNPITILITSNEPWGNIWFSKQHYANELAKLGFTIYFINPTSKWSIKNFFSLSIKLHKVRDNLILVNYQNNFPQTIFKKFFTKLNDIVNLVKINRIIDINNSDLIWWKFEPYRFLNTFPYKNSKTIYHAVDPYNFLWQDIYQVKSADLIVCTNPKYYDYYTATYPKKKTILIPHGISEEEFEQDNQKVSEIKNRYGEFVILIGSIVSDLNFELLKIIADNHFKLLILGIVATKNKNWEEIEKHKNIYYLGEIHAKEIKHYVAASNAGLIIYNFKSITDKNSRTPLKIMNYLAQNKPIITSVKTTLSNLENKCIYNAFDSNEFLSLIQKSFNKELAVDKNEIKMYLSNHYYSKLISEILNNLN